MKMFLTILVVFEKYVEKRDLRKVYPHLAKWSRMIKNNPTYKRVTEMMNEEVEDLIAMNPRFDYGKEK